MNLVCRCIFGGAGEATSGLNPWEHSLVVCVYVCEGGQSSESSQGTFTYGSSNPWDRGELDGHLEEYPMRVVWSAKLPRRQGGGG